MKLISIVIIIPLMAFSQFALNFDEAFGAVKNQKDFTVVFESGTTPSSITLGYTPPAVADAAKFDPGDGQWRTITNRVISLSGKYIRFRGDMRNGSAGYTSLFYSTFNSSAYTCYTRGTLKYASARTWGAFESMFRNCTAIRKFYDSPFPAVTFAPLPFMCYHTFSNCTKIDSLPEGTLNTVRMSGSAAQSMFDNTFYNCTNLTSIPSGTLATSGLNGSGAIFMFYMTFYNCSKLKALPVGTLDTANMASTVRQSMFDRTLANCEALESIPSNTLSTAKLNGSPTSLFPFYYTFYNCKAIGAFNYTISSNILLTASNLDAVGYMFAQSTSFSGNLLWGTNKVTDLLTPSFDVNTFQGCINMSGYAELNANWK